MSKTADAIHAYIASLAAQSVESVVASAIVKAHQDQADFTDNARSAYDALITSIQSGDQGAISAAADHFEELLEEAEQTVAANADAQAAIVGAVLPEPDEARPATEGGTEGGTPATEGGTEGGTPAAEGGTEQQDA